MEVLLKSLSNKGIFLKGITWPCLWMVNVNWNHGLENSLALIKVQTLCDSHGLLRVDDITK